MKKLVVVGKILANEAINANVKRMVIEAPQIAEAAQPGQFVHVKKPDSVNFLRRPFSIADADRENGTITLIYRIVGKGTAEYAAMKVGEAFSILGPIGNGFALKDGRPLLVGGGVGIAPLIYLSRQLKDQKPILLIGGKNKDEVFWEKYLQEFADKIYITTDDGSVGFKGFTVQLLPQILAENNIEHIYTCGPNIMMEGVAKLAHEHDIDCQVSLEKRMACGIGVCLGCTFEGKLTGKRRKVCTEGPVFASKEVF
ncbi:dihydroorotate dehydrogenase electron transfer subunit [Megamonas hypermegale]|uniref:dihydroorotate dehydrogenase electron transfer subunit n=1 Tax=Megamonas hypermegale TaxID=158847 RepID=UPI0025A3F923|nr:dihydroorotate dehydrogenase electron transfer subunit [Megamonas hypermegale]MDM8143514.1 dihydroorotate dehydrogenase electron transfer subunit [Megamonas hypermegale]